MIYGELTKFDDSHSARYPLKRIVLFSFSIISATGALCQTGDASSMIQPAGSTLNMSYKPNLVFNNASVPNAAYEIQPAGIHSMRAGHGSTFASPGGMIDLITNKFGIKMPTRFHYTAKGINFQAGLLTNSRQPKIGAGLSFPKGLNISAGYGVGINGLNGLSKFGSSPMSKNQGIQITAGYRLFGRK